MTASGADVLDGQGLMTGDQFAAPQVTAGTTGSPRPPLRASRLRGSGYWGRLALHQVIPMTESIGKMAVRNASSEEARREAVDQGMRTLHQDGWLNVAEGLTRMGEVRRVIA